MECLIPQPNSISSCSGNGYVCSSPNIGCICNVGWTSVGRFSLGSNGPICLINDAAVRILSYFLTIIPSICNILTIWHYISMAIRKKSCYVITREYKTLFPFFFLILGIASSVYGILKISYPDGQQPLVGRDASISLMVFSATFFGRVGMVIYLNVVMKFLEGFTRMMDHESYQRVSKRFKFLKFYSWLILPVVLVFSILPVIATAYPSQSKALGMAHLIGFGISTIVNDLIFCSSLSILIKELNAYIDGIDEYLSKDLKVVVRRLKAAYTVVGSAALQVGIICIIFGSSNFLFHLNTYHILFAYTIVSPCLYFFVITVSQISHSYDNQIVPTNSDEEKPTPSNSNTGTT